MNQSVINELSTAPYPFFGGLSFSFLGLAYTMLILLGRKTGEASMFSRNSARPHLHSLSFHLMCLAILVAAFKVAGSTMKYFPDWLITETIHFRGGMFSYFDISFVVAMVVMYVIERNWLYNQDTHAEIQ
jgi:hypothetical protein